MLLASTGQLRFRAICEHAMEPGPSSRESGLVSSSKSGASHAIRRRLLGLPGKSELQFSSVVGVAELYLCFGQCFLHCSLGTLSSLW